MILQHSSFFSGAYINGFVGISSREQASYNWPFERYGFSRLIPQTFRDFPWDLFIDIENASRTGNSNRLNSNGMPFWIKEIRSIKTSSHSYFLFKIMTLITLFINFFMASRVTLQGRGCFKFHNIMICDPIFNCRLWGGNPGNSSELKNSVKYLTTSPWIITEAIG